MMGVFSVALLLLSPQLVMAEQSAAAMQAHDEAKLLREKLPQDVSDDTVLDLTTQLITRGVPTEVLTWYLNDEMAKGKTGEALVRDVEMLATTMGGGARMQGSASSLIEQIKADEAIPDASLDAPFIWPESEHLEDLSLMQKEAEAAAKAEPSPAVAEAKPAIAEEKAIEQPAAKESAQTTNSQKAEAADAEAGAGMWDAVFFVLLGVVAVVGAWWAYKMRLHDRALSGLADLTFRAKKWLSGALKGDGYHQAGDDASSVSDTSLQTGSAATGTSASSAADGLNGHLQGVIDRVKTNFQQKDAAPADEEAPAKKGYTRRQ